jgi:DNA-directed RNA polymerase specialized sigma24 family protein
MGRECTDAELLSEARRDPNAFGELYARHVAAVHDWHARRIPWAAADPTAETFAQAWLARRRFRDRRDGTALPWLLGIARNVLRDSARRDRIATQARERLGLPLDLAGEEGYGEVEERLSPRRSLAHALAGEARRPRPARARPARAERHASRDETAADGQRFESAMTRDGLAEFYDPASNAIYATPVVIPRASGSGAKGDSDTDAMLARRMLSPQERVKLLLAGGQLQDEGHVSVDGRDAIRLVTAGGDVTYLVDPDTYVPIELQAKLDGGGAVDLRFPVYEELPASDVGGAYFSLRAQHPRAEVKIDKLAPAKP